MTGSLTGVFASILAHLTWQAVLVGLAAVVALRLVGPRTSAPRYRIAIAALALLALAPAATVARRTGWLAGTSPGWMPAMAEWPLPAGGSLPGSVMPPTDPGAPLEGVLPRGPSAIAGRIALAWRVALPWLLVGWLLGALWSFVSLSVGIVRLHRVRRRSTPAPGLITHDVHRLAARLGMARAPEVRVSDDTHIPLTFGAFRPLVLLPRRFAEDLAPGQVQPVLAHELAHVVRRDYAVNLAQCLLEALLFFHPVVHWLSRFARDEREHCADELAASITGGRRDVAGALLALEELVGHHRGRTLAPAATGGGILLRRIERLLAAAVPAGRLRTSLSFGVLVMAVALVVLATPASAGVEDHRLGWPGRGTAAPDPGPPGFPVVWTGEVGPGQWLRVRNMVGSIRVSPARGTRATVRARVSGGAGLPDLVFAPTLDAGGVTLCAARAAHGRCDAEGYTWFGTREELYRGTVDLVVELPAGASITAASFEGDLRLDGVRGDAEARTGAGAITVRVAAAGDDRSLQLHTGGGEVRVALPPGFGGTLQARLSDGIVEHEMPLQPIGRSSPQRLQASLGAGGNHVQVTSGRGSLILTRAS
jgi:beta-lactamase regulating signal transducer with metallopeptidase domain